MRFVRFLPVIFLLVAACSHAGPAPTPVATPVPEPVAQPAPPPAPTTVIAPAPLPPEFVPASIYFAFDSSELSSEWQNALQGVSDQAQARTRAEGAPVL